MLDDMSQEFEDLIEKLLKDFNGVVSKGLDISNENTSEANKYLKHLAEHFGYTPQYDEVLSNDKSAKDISDDISKAITKSLDSVNKESESIPNCLR